MLVEISKLYKVAFCDPAGSKPQSKGTSRAAITVIGMDEIERKFILYQWAAYCGADEVLSRIFKVDDKWKPEVFGIDTTATQNLWRDLIAKECELKSRQMPKMRWVNFRGEKGRVIETLIQPCAARGQLFRPPEPEVKELKTEFTAFPTGSHRDGLDATAHAIALLPNRPPQSASLMERDNFRRSLIRSGLSDAEIQRRMAEIGN